jgi:hypothetical protein
LLGVIVSIVGEVVTVGSGSGPGSVEGFVHTATVK